MVKDRNTSIQFWEEKRFGDKSEKCRNFILITVTYLINTPNLRSQKEREGNYRITIQTGVTGEEPSEVCPT